MAHTIFQEGFSSLCHNDDILTEVEIFTVEPLQATTASKAGRSTVVVGFKQMDNICDPGLGAGGAGITGA